MADDLKSRLGKLTVKELKKLAKDEGIDLGKARKKAQIIKVIADSGVIDMSFFGEDATPPEDEPSPEEGDTAFSEEEPPTDEPEPDVFDQTEFEEALESINQELEEIGAHITKTLGKIAGIDEVTEDELQQIDANIRSTSHVDVDFDEPKHSLADAKREFEEGKWVDAFGSALAAMETLERQAMGFRKVTYARAIESCEKIIAMYPKTAEGIPRMEHEVLHAKMLFSKDDPKRMLEVMFHLNELIQELPEPERGEEAAKAAPAAPSVDPARPQTVNKKGKCRKCGSRDLEFYVNGTGKCNSCNRVFVWQKKKPHKTTLKDLLKRK